MKVLNFGSCNIDYVYQMEHFIRPGETAPCTALSAGWMTGRSSAAEKG